MPRKKGYKMSEEARLKISKARTGFVMSDEQKKKLSEIRLKSPNRYWLGKKRPDIGKKISKANKGKRAWNKGIPMSDDQKKKCSESQKKRFAMGASQPWVGTSLSKERKQKI